jgi:hypothetical protein
MVHLCMWILSMWSEAQSLMFGGFMDEGTFEPTKMLSKETRTNPLTWEVM